VLRVCLARLVEWRVFASQTGELVGYRNQMLRVFLRGHEEWPRFPLEAEKFVGNRNQVLQACLCAPIQEHDLGLAKTGGPHLWCFKFVSADSPISYIFIIKKPCRNFSRGRAFLMILAGGHMLPQERASSWLSFFLRTASRKTATSTANPAAE